MNKLQDIQLIKNMAIVLVILGHAGCIYAGIWPPELINNDSEIIGYITRYIYSIHMPLYVFISGYIYNFNRVKLNKYLDTKEFIVNKFKNLIIPYLITGITFMIPIQIMFNVYMDNESFLYRIVYDLLLSKKPGHLWYLIMLFNVFVIFRIIEEKIKQNSYTRNLVFLSIINIASVFIPNIYQISNTFKYLLYFYVGYVCCEKREHILKCKSTLLFIAHFILFNFNYLLLSNIGEYILARGLKWMLDGAIAIIGVLCLFTYINEYIINNKIIKKVANNKLYTLINKYNFYIYLLHQPIMLSFISILKSYDISPIIMYMILFILTLLFAIGISSILKRFNKILLKIINIKKLKVLKGRV